MANKKRDEVPERPRFTISIDPETLARIEDYRYENRIPSRSETIQILVKKTLDDGEQSA